MAVLPIGGDWVLLDDEDVERVAAFLWNRCGGYHATRCGRQTVYLHHVLVGRPVNRNSVVDHRNGNPNDNRKANLRFATCQQNARNLSPRCSNTTGCVGVTWSKKENKFIATVRARGKRVRLGCYKNLADAIAARRQAEKREYGEFAPSLSRGVA